MHEDAGGCGFGGRRQLMPSIGVFIVLTDLSNVDWRWPSTSATWEMYGERSAMDKVALA
jgi:hypothetical protein